MSRALDKDVKEALKRGDHRGVFLELSCVLLQPSAELLEIEFLGKSHILEGTSFLKDGNAIAIPKLRLVQAFLAARRIFLEYLECGQTGLEGDISRATAVMLLMDPEHLTAANTRKRLLKTRFALKDDAEAALKEEKHLVDSMLTSRLHRHTKSPTLWNHRRWLMEQFKAHEIAVNAEDDLEKVVMISGERHPRNYYAWCHARYLVNSIVARSAERERLMYRLVVVTKKWCFSHHDDISGWQFLLSLLDKLPGEVSSTIQATLQLTESFKWRNESVWYFLRYAVVRLPLDDVAQEEFRRAREMLHGATQEGSTERKILEDAQQTEKCIVAQRRT